jgi:hypothetical protein
MVPFQIAPQCSPLRAGTQAAGASKRSIRDRCGRQSRLFSTTLGTAQDITLQELHIESFHPADAEAEALLRRLSG